MSMMYPIQTAKHSKNYYRIRFVVRVVFYTVFFFLPAWALLVLVG
jgi:hypothetical protein